MTWLYRDQENNITVETDKPNENDLQNVETPSDLVSCDNQSSTNITLTHYTLDMYICETFKYSLTKYSIRFIS